MSLAKEVRLRKGYTLEQAAKRLGISAGYLSQIESGQRHISSERAENIATIYDVSRELIFQPTRYGVRLRKC